MCMNLIHRVEELSRNYGGGSRKAIGSFILKEKEHLHEYTVQEISDRTYTSKAALTRFAKDLGFSGWREFIKKFVEERRYEDAHYTDIDPNYPFGADSSRKDILNVICSLQVESLLDTADLLEENKDLEKVIDLIQDSHRIAIFGLNPNLSLAEIFKRKMLTIGKVVETPMMGDSGLLASTLKEDDCAIIVSYSGNNMQHLTMRVLPDLLERKVPIIAMTSDGDNLLRQKAKYTLTISSRERLYDKISTFSTETSILFIFNILFSYYFQREYEANLRRKIQKGEKLEEPRTVGLQKS